MGNKKLGALHTHFTGGERLHSEIKTFVLSRLQATSLRPGPQNQELAEVALGNSWEAAQNCSQLQTYPNSAEITTAVGKISTAISHKTPKVLRNSLRAFSRNISHIPLHISPTQAVSSQRSSTGCRLSVARRTLAAGSS